MAATITPFWMQQNFLKFICLCSIQSFLTETQNKKKWFLNSNKWLATVYTKIVMSLACITWKVTVSFFIFRLAIVGGSFMLEAFSWFFIGLPINTSNACCAFQLHVSIWSEVILGGDKFKTWKKVKTSLNSFQDGGREILPFEQDFVKRHYELKEKKAQYCKIHQKNWGCFKYHILYKWFIWS